MKTLYYATPKLQHGLLRKLIRKNNPEIIKGLLIPLAKVMGLNLCTFHCLMAPINSAYDVPRALIHQVDQLYQLYHYFPPPIFSQFIRSGLCLCADGGRLYRARKGVSGVGDGQMTDDVDFQISVRLQYDIQRNHMLEIYLPCCPLLGRLPGPFCGTIRPSYVTSSYLYYNLYFRGLAFWCRSLLRIFSIL
jgi:hypothetical protein